MHGEQAREDLGHATIVPGAPVPAASRGTWKIIYTAGSTAVKPGGRVRVTIPHGFSPPQLHAFFEPGFVTVEPSKPGLEFRVKVVYDIFCRLDRDTGHSGAWGRNIFIEIGEPGLEPGEGFTLTYGNADYYGGEPFSNAGARTRELSGDAEFTVAVDPDGTRTAPFSGYWRLPASPRLEIVPREPAWKKAIVPSDIISAAIPGSLPVHVITSDRFNNPVCVDEEPGTRFGLEESFRDVTVAWFYIDDTGGRVFSNPARVHSRKPEWRWFWGDIHGHTLHSDGLGTIDEYFDFAARVAQLDFTAITDHDDIGPRLQDDEWELIQRKVEEYNEPGVLVTLLGHEYRNGRCDMNVYYPGSSGRLLRGTDGELADPTILTREVKALGGMVVPHMHFGIDYRGFDPDTYRVLEIYSQHGSAEYKGCPREIPYLRKQVQKSSETNEGSHVHDILQRGHRLGFTAGSDTHSGRPGFSDWTRVCRTYMGGLTAVLARSLTRGDVWEALWNRRCYATTGNRSLLDFRVNGAMMGSETTSRVGGQRVVTVNVHGDGIIDKITVFRSGEVFQHVSGIGSRNFRGKFTDSGRDTPDWYYLRVDLEGGEMAWSSPVWVDLIDG